jgi:MFS family permease
MAEANDSRELRRFKWVIGVPYFVQGTSGLTEIPILYFIKNVLAMGDAGGQLFDSLRSGGWLIKPLWGYISDRFPLYRYRRKSWYVLMALLALVFWSLSAVLAAAGLRVPVLYLVAFNLAFATYAFVDVVCDAIMVEQGRRLQRVGSFVNFQWLVLALANTGALYLSGWFQERIEAGRLDYWIVFLAAGLPPLLTALVGWRNIEEEPVAAGAPAPAAGRERTPLLDTVRTLRSRFAGFRRDNRPLWLLVLFLFFWKFRPSIGFIERSYLIDVRGFQPGSFGTILALGGVSFLLSIVVYRRLVQRFPRISWHQYLYAMVALGVASFPLSFYLYLNPEHPWWAAFAVFGGWPASLNPLPHWNRYEWFRLITETVLGFAAIPAFLIPLTLAGETVKLRYAAVGYAFLMSLANLTTVFEGVVGAGLYKLFSQSWMGWLPAAFHGSWLDIAGTADERTLILEMFVYISLVFTLLTIPFIRLLKREFERQGLVIHLGATRADS